MSAVSVSFNANQLKRDVAEILQRKVDALTTNVALKDRLQELFYVYVIQLADFPEQTGALKLKGEGYVGSYRRVPGGSWKGHHGIEFDAYEIRPNKPNKHYASMVLERVFGDPVSQGFIDNMMSEGLWDEFCEAAAPIIAEAMNNG